jgi:hypothetical protein
VLGGVLDAASGLATDKHAESIGHLPLPR